MNKKILYLIIIVILFLVGLLGLFMYNEYKKNIEKVRYETILKDFEEALVWELNATGVSKKNCDPLVAKRSTISSSVLILQGYLRKSSMLDIDGKSYCKAYANTFKTDDCGVDYKIYLKCNNYRSKGYIDWK